MVLAHGAGAPMDSPFMNELAGALEGHGIACLRFEFLYMEKRREDGKKRPPDRQPKLLECFRDVVEQVRARHGPDCRLLVGGKSMGGRMASLLAAQSPEGIAGVACYGYPFHPPGKPDRWRTDHFPDICSPMLIVQGTRDPFGKCDEVESRDVIPDGSRLVWLEGGNHDFEPLVRSGRSRQDLIDEAARATRQFAEAMYIKGDQ
ncbi:alpha/beta family hydrolase [Marinobacter oulmenensis]